MKFFFVVIVALDKETDLHTTIIATTIHRGKVAVPIVIIGAMIGGT